MNDSQTDLFPDIDQHTDARKARLFIGLIVFIVLAEIFTLVAIMISESSFAEVVMLLSKASYFFLFLLLLGFPLIGIAFLIAKKKIGWYITAFYCAGYTFLLIGALVAMLRHGTLIFRMSDSATLTRLVIFYAGVPTAAILTSTKVMREHFNVPAHFAAWVYAVSLVLSVLMFFL